MCFPIVGREEKQRKTTYYELFSVDFVDYSEQFINNIKM